MKARDFCYWLQGYFELVGDSKDDMSFSHAQVLMIARHLHMVFQHEIDPSMGDQAMQDKLDALHRPDPLSQKPTSNPGKDDVIYRC